MEIEDAIKLSTLEELMSKLENRKIPRKKFFCRVFHDLHYLIDLKKEDYVSSNWKSSIEEVQNSYEKIYWRHYYFFLYSFIFYSYSTEKCLEVEQAFKEQFEEIEYDEDFEGATDYPFFRKHYPQMAVFKALIDAKIFYEKLAEDKSLFAEIEDLELLEKRLDIRKNDIAFEDGKIKMMYLTYSRNPHKSHATRVRNFGKQAFNQQVVAKEEANYWAKEIISRYYQLKHYNSKLTVDQFLVIEDARNISRRTFFTYKNYYDKKIGKGKWNKTTEEKAYDRYILELEKNSDLKIDKKLCKKIGVGQKALREQIEKENNRI